jgi:mono/diheme cytochrome c family protein
VKYLLRAFSIAVLVPNLFGTPNLQSANAQDANPQTTGAIAARQKPLYARLAWKRASPADLELGGDIPGANREQSKRYITRDQLLALPQVSYTVTNDANFIGPTQISGVALEELTQKLAANPESDIALAICTDGYETHYTHAYITAQHPVLVLKIDGKDPADWPKFHESGADMGPYLISSPDFKPSFKILSHEDEPQIPWGVVRLEIKSEAAVFDAIRPRSVPPTPEVEDGFRIAQQNCFRCHNSGGVGGTKAQRPWTVLSTWATASPDYFKAYIHDPQSKNPKSQMQAFPNYDAATLNALTKYFQSFTDDAKGGKP